MTQLSKAEDIWVLKPTREDLIAGANYAAITLPWTFNRMSMNTSSSGQQSRALNIAKGIVGQEILRRELEKRSISAQVQRKSHRDDDLFDFQLPINGVVRRLDVKSVNYYSNYSESGRSPLSSQLIVANASYPGPDWRRFFPMLVPHTQVQQAKDAYCFAISSSIDFRRDIDTDRAGYTITAFPYGNHMAFMARKQLCIARENAEKGFYASCSYSTDAFLFNGHGLTFTLIGEWDGQMVRRVVELKPGTVVENVGPFSCLSSFQLDRNDYDRIHGRIEISISRNDFTSPILNTTKSNINVLPTESLILQRSDFCNLMLPTDYTIYFIGWVMKEDFLQACRKYSGWVWPNDNANRYHNQPWTQITESDRKSIGRAGFENCIQGNPHLLKAGWMKTNGQGGGACCYVFPNIGSRGGVKETNLYALPQDLQAMVELGK